MTQAAFYAPMKAPDHPTPSGDREMARALMTALGKVQLVSNLRIFDKQGDADLQTALQADAAREAERVIAQAAKENWPFWVTYHNYYKAPDLLGPVVTRALGIPYIIIEASRAAKRLQGPWAQFEALAAEATDHADVLISLTARDEVALAAAQRPGQRLIRLAPFLPREDLPPATTAPRHRLITVAMMREGDKLASYQRLAEVLAHVTDLDWTLDIIGDGTARGAVKAAFQPLTDRVTFLGRLSRDQIDTQLSRSGTFLWPGINEAFGMVYLEAQAAGLLTLAEDRPGVREIIQPEALAPADDPAGFAAKIRQFLTHPTQADALADQGRTRVAAQHLLPAAHHTLTTVLEAL